MSCSETQWRWNHFTLTTGCFLTSNEALMCACVTHRGLEQENEK